MGERVSLLPISCVPSPPSALFIARTSDTCAYNNTYVNYDILPYLIIPHIVIVITGIIGHQVWVLCQLELPASGPVGSRKTVRQLPRRALSPVCPAT